MSERKLRHWLHDPLFVMQNGSYIGTAVVVVLMIAVIVWFLYQGLSAPGLPTPTVVR